MLKDALEQAHADIEVELVPMVSNADWKPEQGETFLSESLGGKGQFASEIENALLNGDID